MTETAGNMKPVPAFLCYFIRISALSVCLSLLSRVEVLAEKMSCAVGGEIFKPRMVSDV